MKRVFLGSIITIFSVVAILAGYYYYQKIKMPRSGALNAIPNDAAFIIESKNFTTTWDKIRASKIWKELSDNASIELLDEQINTLDSIIKKNNNFSQVIAEQSIFVSAHVTSVNDYDLLFCTAISNINPEDFINTPIIKLLNDKVPVTKQNYQGNTIIEFPLTVGGVKRTLSYTISKGVFILSFNPLLVESAIKTLKENKSLLKDASFSKVVDAAVSKVDANIYINYKYLSKFLSTYLKANAADDMQGWGDFGSWSGLDVNIKPEAILLNGLATADSTGNNFLSTLTNQTPQKINIANVLPQSTAVFMYWGISDFSQYYNDYKKYIHADGRAESEKKRILFNDALIKRAEQKYKISIAASMQGWVGNEMALAITNPSDTAFGDNVFAVFNARNINTAKQSLKDLADATDEIEVSAGDDTDASAPSTNIAHINIKSMIPALFGKAFAKIQNTYYVIVGNYVVFANTEESLKAFVDDNVRKNILSRDANYNALARNIGTEANFYLFVNIPSSLNIASAYAKDSLAKSLQINDLYFSKFNAVAVQFSANPKIGGFYNEVYIQTSTPKPKSNDASLVWSAQLDTSVSMTPQFVYNHITGSKDIIVQDDANKLYLIDNAGEITWSKQLPSKILGKINTIDFFKNGKVQYLFNTKSGIHLIDRNGEYMANYPIKLKGQATAGLSVFDYDHKREYRIFVPCGNRVYGYQANAKPIEGWDFIKPVSSIRTSLQYFYVGGKDYLIISDTKGQVYLVDRKGAMKAKADKNIFISAKNEWVLEMNDKPHLVSSDTAGNIFSLYFDGSTEVQKIKDFSVSSSFQFKDINADKLKDYIYLDNNLLTTYNQDTTKIFDYQFDAGDKEISKMTMSYYSLPDNNMAVGVTLPISNQLFLFNSDGTLFNGFPLKGSTGFSISSLSRANKMDEQYLLTGSIDKHVYLYKIK